MAAMLPAIFFGHGNPMNAVLKQQLHGRLAAIGTADAKA